MNTYRAPVVPCSDATTKKNHPNVATRRRPLFLAVALVLSIGCLCVWPRGNEAIAAIPALAQWQSQMLTFGQIHCTTLKKVQDLAATYYDATAVYLQIYRYTGDPKWLACAQAAKLTYRDTYVLRPNVHGQVPGYWNFTTGFLMDYQINGDTISKAAAILLSQNASYAADYTPLGWSASASVSREVAYAIRSYLHAEKLGVHRRARLAGLVGQAFGHIDQWFISKSYRNPASFAIAPKQYYIQPFMAGLTMDALIMYYDATSDPQERSKIVSSIKVSLDWLWANAWVAADRAFWYENHVPDASVPFFHQPGAPDLNLLIAPAYAWLYKITGNTTYRDRGDQVFAGGVQGAWLYGVKQFNQSYLRSFDYVKWRQQADAANGGAAVPPVAQPVPQPLPQPSIRRP